MNYLGIDYGRKKIGLSFADGPLATPFKVLRVKSLNLGIEELLMFIRDLHITHIVIGVSEGEMGKEIREFGAKLEEVIRHSRLDVNPIIFFHDETLSTRDAQRLAIESGKKQKKRREMEDSYAATIMLQDYLDKN